LAYKSAIIGELNFSRVKFRLNYDPDTPEEYFHYCPGDQAPVSPRGELGNARS